MRFKKFMVAMAVFAIAIIGLSSTPVVAEELTRIKNDLTTVAKDTTIDGSVFLSGEEVNIHGTVKGDVYCAAKTITISGTVEGDVLCAGQRLSLGGVVSGDIRVAGETIALNGKVDGSVTLAGSNVNTDTASKIGRDATILAGKTIHSGVVGRDLVFGGGDFMLTGKIGRDAQITADKINAIPSAKIAGNLSYRSSNEAQMPAGVVVGETNRTAIAERGETTASSSGVLIGLFIAVVMFVTLTIVVTAIAPRYVHRVSDVSKTRDFAILFLVGLVSLVAAPMVMLLLLVSIVGIYAGLAVAVAVVLGYIVGGSLVAYRMGRFMMNNKAHPLMFALVGSFALGVLGIVPFVGWVVIFASTLIGFGMVVVGLKTQYSNKPIPVQADKKKKIVKKPRA